MSARHKMNMVMKLHLSISKFNLWNYSHNLLESDLVLFSISCNKNQFITLFILIQDLDVHLTWKISSLCDSNEWSFSFKFLRSHSATVCKSHVSILSINKSSAFSNITSDVNILLTQGLSKQALPLFWNLPTADL